MKKKFFIIFLFFFLAALVLPTPIIGYAGSYNKVSGWIWCSSKSSCIHEIGHKLDDEAGWISHTNEFSLTVSAFVWHEIANNDPPHPFVYKIMKHPGVFRYTFMTVDNNSELYASIFEWSGGVSENMPELLRPYYDWERAAELMEYYEVNDE